MSRLSLSPLEKKAVIEIRDNMLPQYTIFKLGILDSIQFKLWGHVKVGSIKKSRGEIEAHLIRCDVHGYQVTTPSGHYEMLLCPACIKERVAREELKKAPTAPIEVELSPINKYLNKNLEKNK